MVDHAERVQIGPYNVLNEVARGGMGVVYRARGADGRDVALKLVLPQKSASRHARKRFQAEVEALQRLRHPGIAPIVGAGEHSGCPWLALEFVEGETLEDRLQRGPLPLEQALAWVEQLADALSYVHSCGLLHRDLKPANVLLRGEQALLTDFGLVLDEQSGRSRLTLTGIFQGTPGYWSPEQAQGEVHAFGPWTDVYGLGGVLYACLTGRPPLDRGSLQEAMHEASAGKVVPPSQRRPGTPPWISDLCMRCLTHEPQQRPQTVAAVADALRAGEQRVDGRPSRRRWAVAAAVVGFAALGGWFATRGIAKPSVGEPEAARALPEELEEAVRLFDAERYEDALNACDALLRSKPQHAHALAARGQALYKLGEHEQARLEVRRALELNPHSPFVLERFGGVFLRLGHFAELRAALDSVLASDAKPPLAYHYRGAALLQLRDHEAGIADCDRAIALGELSGRSHAIRALGEIRLQRFEQALADCNRALKLGHKDATLYGNRAAVFASLGRYDESLADCERALELNPNFAAAYLNRGMSHASLGRRQAAIADLDRAIELAPSAAAYENRGRIKSDLKQHAEAIEDATRALELEPARARAYELRGKCTALLGDHAAAIVDYTRALELDPSLIQSWTLRGRARASLGQFARAIEDFDEVLSRDVSPQMRDKVRKLRARAHTFLR